jgi:hypothetical protein
MRARCILLLFVLLVATAAQASFTSTVSGSTATMIGNSVAPLGDALRLSQSGGLLVHSRFVGGDPGFNSPFDFDSTIAGDQTLAASAATTVNITAGGGSDVITIGGAFSSFAAAADTLLAAFNVSPIVSNKTRLTIDDALSVLNPTFLITASAITATGLNVGRPAPFTFVEINVFGGPGNDTFNVQSVPSTVLGSELLRLWADNGTNSVTIGTTGTLAGMQQPIQLSGALHNTTLTINDSAFAGGRTGTLTASNFTGPLLGIFSWDPAVLSTLNLNLGSGLDNITVSGVPSAAITTVDTDGGDDAIAVSVAGLLTNSTTRLNGGIGNDTFTVNAGAGGAGATLAIDGQAPVVAPGDVLSYSGATGTIVGNQIQSAGNTTVTFTSIETFIGLLNPNVPSLSGIALLMLGAMLAMTALTKMR